MSLAIDSIFTHDEAALLQQGIPNLAALSGSLLIPFSVQRLERPSIAWINRRWFLERGFDLTDPATSAKVQQWIVDEFSYIVAGPTDCSESTAHTRRIYFADRYGSTEGMSPHGGSGRVATVGHFQVKGVGVTPLVGAEGAPGHSHGCCSLAECIREVVYSEIMGAEFPYGAIPAIAIIDTGLYYSSPDASEIYDQNVRRALLIRPSVLRLAHVERAPMFQRSLRGFRNSQFDDSCRARDIARAWERGNLDCAGRQTPSLEALIDRLAHQVAFSHIHRIFGGGVFSSNLTMFGELVDFGNAHVFPNWMSSHVLGHSTGFCSELTGLLRVVHSLSFFLHKYNHPGEVGRPADHSAMIVAAYEKYIDLEILGLFDVEAEPPYDEDVQSLLAGVRRLLVEERRSHVYYVHGKALPATQGVYSENQLADGIVNASSSGSLLVREILRSVRSARRRSESDKDAGVSDKHQWRNTMRYLDSRVEVDRGALLERVESLVEEMQPGSCTAHDRARIDDFVDVRISLSRRIWRNLPKGYSVLCSVSHAGSSALLCARADLGTTFVWIEGTVSQGRYFLFDSEIPINLLEGSDVRVEDRTWFATLPEGYECQFTEQGVDVLAKGCRIRLPPMLASWGRDQIATDSTS